MTACSATHGAHGAGRLLSEEAILAAFAARPLDSEGELLSVETPLGAALIGEGRASSPTSTPAGSDACGASATGSRSRRARRSTSRSIRTCARSAAISASGPKTIPSLDPAPPNGCWRPVAT
jgi:hypothetical protein